MKSIIKTIQFVSILIVGMALMFTFCGRNDSKDNNKGIGRLIILNQLTRSSSTTSSSTSGTTITIPQGLGQ